ncbi:MAG: alpha/beta hydrolase family esterase [Rhizobiaceae bacterium]
MPTINLYFAALTLAFAAISGAATACVSGHVCVISGPDGGTYHLAEPEVKPQKIFIFFHGHNGSGAGVVRNKRLVGALHKAGFVVVAPDGPKFTFSGRTSRGWAARREGEEPRGKRNDILFVEKLITEVAKRYAIDPGQTVLSGFSSGGSMAWYFSCYSRMPLGGVVAVAGGLRRPLPGTETGDAVRATAGLCPGGPRNLVHIHGFSDKQVPLEGRAIRSWHQGDVFEGLAIQRQTNQCRSRPDRMVIEDGYWCRTWTKCNLGKNVSLCLHKGGHGLPKNWLPLGLNWLNTGE